MWAQQSMLWPTPTKSRKVFSALIRLALEPRSVEGCDRSALQYPVTAARVLVVSRAPQELQTIHRTHGDSKTA
jgi:hypothetical protein